ncbi:MAG: hypothetical protein PWR12_1787, partial [Eubacteriaceae bacterium]|nr:hypothetical protein [Eubacteriaceae bacterium]
KDQRTKRCFWIPFWAWYLFDNGIQHLFDLQKVTEECCNKQAFSMVLNFADVEFISSAGLRVLLLIQKKANAMSGVFTLRNVSETIQEVFQMTGFADILTVE